MIYSIKLRNNSRAPIPHVRSGFRFNDIKFTDGVNILVGKNGSGKSTVLNLLRMYTFCDGELESTMSPCNLMVGKKGSFSGLTGSHIEASFYDGVDVVADYSTKTFNLCGGDGYFQHNSFDPKRVLAQMERSGRSDGEKQVFMFELLCGNMFGKDLGFDIDLGYCPESDRECAKKYYARNNKRGKKPTLIMDEPDRNLDVYNAEFLCRILGDEQRDDTQVIASLHNIGLIYRLMDCNKKKVNFIEMTDSYLDDVSRFMRTI